jgi:hypothetical protein
VLAAPLLWLVPAFVHPNEAGNLFEGIADQANKWIFVHVAQLVLTPFIAAGVWMLLGGVQSVAAQVARAALVIWMVFFSAFDAVAGIATGVLTRYANSLAGQERETVGRAIDFLFHDSQLAGGEFSVLGNIGHADWVVLAIAAAVALWRARLSRVIVWATLVSVLFATHSGIGAVVGLVALFVAELLSFLSRSGEAAPSKALEPAQRQAEDDVLGHVEHGSLRVRLGQPFVDAAKEALSLCLLSVRRVVAVRSVRCHDFLVSDRSKRSERPRRRASRCASSRKFGASFTTQPSATSCRSSRARKARG